MLTLLDVREEQRCAECGVKQNAMTHAGGRDHVPAPGDLSICVHCGGVSQLDSELRRQRVDLRVLEATLPARTWAEVQKARAAVLERKH